MDDVTVSIVISVAAIIISMISVHYAIKAREITQRIESRRAERNESQ
jgi:hypothetical protein